MATYIETQVCILIIMKLGLKARNTTYSVYCSRRKPFRTFHTALCIMLRNVALKDEVIPEGLISFCVTRIT